MHAPQVHHALREARELILAAAPGILPLKADLSVKKVANRYVAFAHALWMYEEASKFLIAEDIGKAMRWLCFIQGILWTYGIASIDEFRRANAQPAP